MIGSRVLAAATLLALLFALDGGGPRPEVTAAAHAAVVSAGERTAAAIDQLESELGSAIDAGRAGSARVVAGDADPAERLSTAAERTLAAATAANRLEAALVELQRARLALRPDADALSPAPSDGTLLSISGQLSESAEAGAAFADMRRRAEGLSQALVDALDAAAAGRFGEADQLLDAALGVVAEVSEWEDDAPVLATWIDTTDAMIRAMRRLVDAVRADDPGRAADARAAFDTAARDSAEADRSLRIGLGEAGSAQTSVPLGRLARALAELQELSLDVGAVLEASSR